MRVNGPRGVLAPGETVKLEAVETDSYGMALANRSLESTWGSSSPEVATVSPLGLVTAVAVGTTEISVTYLTLSGTTLVRVTRSDTRTYGRIDAAVAADIVTYNQEVLRTSQWRQKGTITRWELPVSIYVDPSVDKAKVEQAMRAWRDLVGVTYQLIDHNTGPRIVVLSNSGDPMGGVDDTNIDNSARLASVYIPAHTAFTVELYQHELGHALGALDHIPGGIMAATGPLVVRERDIRFFAELYRLPHGAHVDLDGSWTVH